MKKVHPKVVDAINRNFNFIERSLSPDNYDILRTENFEENDLFIITEIELRFFRNFIIYIWEAIYLSHFNLTKKNNSESNMKFNFEKNKFQFHLVKTFEESQALNEVQTFYTEKMSNFYISTYVCPNCKKEPVILYKTLYHPNISLSKITQKEEHQDIKMERVFTCPQCRSFFISKYKELLSDNNGINLLKLSDDDYLMILEQFNIKGTAYMPEAEVDMNTMANEQSMYALENMLKEMKANRNRLNKRE